MNVQQIHLKLQAVMKSHNKSEMPPWIPADTSMIWNKNTANPQNHTLNYNFITLLKNNKQSQLLIRPIEGSTYWFLPFSALAQLFVCVCAHVRWVILERCSDLRLTPEFYQKNRGGKMFTNTNLCPAKDWWTHQYDVLNFPKLCSMWFKKTCVNIINGHAWKNWQKIKAAHDVKKKYS